MKAIIKEGQDASLHTIIARTDDSNDISIELCKSFSFQNLGTMREMGEKCGKLLKVYLIKLIY